jgi:hypothetical protein
MWLALAALVGVLGIYLVIRPTLKALPQFKAFYAEADTIWQKAFALAYKSATVIVSYVGAAIGFALSQLGTVAALVGDPSFQAEVSKVIGADTRVLGVVMIGFSVIVFAARMRSIVQGA